LNHSGDALGIPFVHTAYDVASVSASPVPLPAALPLALLGFGALAAVARRRRA